MVLLIDFRCQWRAAENEAKKKAEKRALERKEQEARERERREAELREVELRQAQRLESIRAAFSSYPWNLWPPEAHDGTYQMKRIERAFDSQYMRVLSYCPADYAARVKGESSSVYKVTPMKCECPDFEKRLLPCKHMYHLAWKMYNGFDTDTYVGEDCPFPSDQERRGQWNRKNVESSVPHKNILQFLRTNGSAPMRDIKRSFSALDGSDVSRAVTKLYEVGSITRKKGTGGAYIYSISQKSHLQPDLFEITLPTFPPHPFIPSQYRGYTNIGTFEVHGANVLTGKQKKVIVHSLDGSDAMRYARLYHNLTEPLSAIEVRSPKASDRQCHYILDLMISSKVGYDKDALTTIDAAALIEKGQRCQNEEGHLFDDFDRYEERKAQHQDHLDEYLSEKEWNETCLARVYASMYFDQQDYEAAIANRYHRTY